MSIISFELAELAKNKGFQHGCDMHYVKYHKDQVDPEYPDGGGPFSMVKDHIEIQGSYLRNNIKNIDFSNKNWTQFEAPTQSLLQKWLRDEHDIHIWCEKQDKDVKNKYGYRIGSDLEHSNVTFYNWSYEEALERGLIEAINLIK